MDISWKIAVPGGFILLALIVGAVLTFSQGSFVGGAGCEWTLAQNPDTQETYSGETVQEAKEKMRPDFIQYGLENTNLNESQVEANFEGREYKLNDNNQLLQKYPDRLCGGSAQ